MSLVQGILIVIVSVFPFAGVQSQNADCYIPHNERNVTSYDQLNLDEGYCHPAGWWVPGRPAEGSNKMVIPLHFTGYLSRYDPGVMERVLSQKGWDISLSGHTDGAAIMSCNSEHIGQDLYFRIVDETDWIGPLIVADCAAYLDAYPIVYHTGIALEVGFTTAMEIGMVTLTPNGNPDNLRGNIFVEVAIGSLPPPEETPADFQTWFLRNFRFEGGITSAQAWAQNPDPRETRSESIP